jgi:hypothetical protein
MATTKRAAKRRAKKTPTPITKGANGSEYLYAMGPIGAAQVRIEREGGRLRKWAIRLKSYGLPSNDAVTALEKAATGVEEALAALNDIPKGWRPARGTVGATPIETGAQVTVRDAYAQKYVGIDGMSAKSAMTVLQIIGGRVVLDVKGIKMVLPRAHVVGV